MAAKEIKAKLKSAKSAISEKQYGKALEICEETLSLDASCYHALVFAGLCSLELSHKQRSKEFYQKATALSQDDPLAWKGLASYYDRIPPQDVEECRDAIRAYKQCLQFQQGEEQRVRTMKGKLAELHRRCGEEDEAYRLLCELMAADPEGEGLWESLLNLLLAWRVVKKEGLDKLEGGLTALERHPEDLHLERMLKYASLLSTLFYHTSSEEEGQALFHRCKELAGTGGGGACCEVLANMLLCRSLCNYPFSPSVELQQFCGEVAEGGEAGGRAARLCHAAVLLVGSSKLREALKMVDGEEEEEPVALSRALRGIVLFLMHHYKQSAVDITWCLDHISLLPTSLQTVYHRNFRLYILWCQWCTGEESAEGVLPALWQLQTECNEAFVADHVMPLMARIHVARGELEEAEQIVSSLQCPEPTARCLKAKLALAQEDPSTAVQVLREGECSGAEENCLMGVTLWLRGEAGDRREAYRHFVKAASEDPFNWEPFFYIGQFQECDVGDRDRAAQCYRKALEHAPGNRRAGQALADLLEGRGEEEEGLLSLYKDITSTSSVQEAKWAWLRMGLLLKRRGDHKEALTSLFNAIKADPKDSHCWECVGEAYLARGSLTPALRSFSKALELTPNSLYCHIRVASVSCDLGHLAAACSSYETALHLDPTYLPALKGLGDTLVCQARVCLQSNRDGRAVEMVAKALPLLVRAAKLKPRYSCVWKSLGDACVCLVDVDLEQSPWKLTLPQELHGNGSEAVSKRDLLEAATRVYSQLCHLSPDSSAAWHDLGMCLYFRGREKIYTDEGKEQREGLLRGSLEALQKAVSLLPDNAHHWCSLGAVATTMGPSYYGLAQHAFIKSLQLNEQDAVTWTNLGALYLKTDRVQLANEAFNRAHSADPQYAPAWTGQGMVAQIVGDSFEALDHFRHSSELLFAPESCRCYAYWVCSSLRTLPLSKAVHPATGHLLPVTERAVLQACDGVEKLSARCSDDAKALNLLGLLCEHEGLLSRAVHHFERALDVLGRQRMTNTHHSIVANLARVLAKRGEEGGCRQSVKVLTQQLPPSNWLGQAFLALALHHCREGEKAGRAFATATSGYGQADHASHLLVGQAMCAFFSDQHRHKDLLFQAFKSEPPSPFALLALLALGALLPDHTLLLAATEEALKVADGSFVLHPTFVDVLVSVMIMLIFDKEGEHCLGKVRELWMKLSQDSPDVHFSTKADLVSVFEHLRSGQVREAQLSAAKYCHNHPGDLAEAVLMAVLQM